MKRKLFGQCETRSHKIRRAQEYISELDKHSLREQGASMKEILEYWVDGLDGNEFEQFFKSLERKMSPLKEKWTKETLEQVEKEWRFALQQTLNSDVKVEFVGKKIVNPSEIMLQQNQEAPT